jgi:hypothetical protein
VGQDVVHQMFGEIEDAYSAQREMAPQIEEDLDKDAESDVVFAAFQVNVCGGGQAW